MSARTANRRRAKRTQPRTRAEGDGSGAGGAGTDTAADRGTEPRCRDKSHSRSPVDDDTRTDVTPSVQPPAASLTELKTDWLEERVETRDTLGQSRGRQLKRNPNDLKRNPNDLKRKPKPS
ncbi:unnamed protein product [Gadus morhua 'NCC']